MKWKQGAGCVTAINSSLKAPVILHNYVVGHVLLYNRNIKSSADRMLNGWSFKYVVLSTNFQNYFRPCSLRQPVLRPLCGSVSVLQNFRIVKHKAVKLFSNYLILSQKLFSDPLLQSIIVKRFGLLKDWPINIVCVIV